MEKAFFYGNVNVIFKKKRTPVTFAYYNEDRHMPARRLEASFLSITPIGVLAVQQR